MNSFSNGGGSTHIMRHQT